MKYDYETFDIDRFLESNPSFEDVREVLNWLDTERYKRMEDKLRIEDECGVSIEDGDLVDELDDIEDMICRVGHLVVNNAFFIISKGAESEFTYTLTEEDKKDYRFSMFFLHRLEKVIYGGAMGTIDLVLDNGAIISDDDIDCQDMFMLASYFYDNIANNL